MKRTNYSILIAIILVLVGYKVLPAQAVFQRVFGDTTFTIFQDLTTATNDDVVAAGIQFVGTDIPGIMARFDENGQNSWAYKYEAGVMQDFIGISRSGDGGFLVAGRIDTSSSGTDNGFVMKTDENGLPIWTTVISSPQEEYLVDVMEIANGNVVAVGKYESQTQDEYHWFVELDSMGNVLKSFAYFPTANANSNVVQPWPGGGYIIGGAGRVNFIDEAYLFKISEMGVLEWYRSYGSFSGSEGIYDFVIQDDKSIVFTGIRFQLGSEIFVGKTDSVGNLLWFKDYGGIDIDKAFKIREVNNGFIISGSTEDLDGEAGPLLFKIDSNGDLEWTKVYSGSGLPAYRTGLVQTKDGYILSQTTLPNQGTIQGLLVRTDESGNSCNAVAVNLPSITRTTVVDTPVVYAVLAGSQSYSVNMTRSPLLFPETTVCFECDSAKAQFFYAINGLEVSMNNASTGSEDFHWDFGDGNSSTDSLPIHTYAANGNYTICLIVSNGCSTDTLCQTLMVVRRTDAILPKLSMTAVPNPSTEAFVLDFGSQILGSVQIEVRDILGTLVYTRRHTNARPRIPVMEWSSGLYFVTAQSRSGNGHCKVWVRK